MNKAKEMLLSKNIKVSYLAEKLEFPIHPTFVRCLRINLESVPVNSRKLKTGGIIMYKLLIVEDEIWEREGLVDFIDWRQLNIQIVGTASNGIQGLKMAKLHQPDIIITDIRMPILDGLELSKRVKFFLPQCKIIIITGYDDFEYARDAIHAGVYNYLLKPVQKKELLNTINRVIKDILQEKKHVEQIHI